jgi:hypothetical protein
MEFIKQSVASSNIDGLDWRDGTLRIWFWAGSIFDYQEVPEDVFHEFMNAQSVGRYFQKNIKGKYDSVKIR